MSKLTIADCRPAVIDFAIVVEESLRRHDKKGNWDPLVVEPGGVEHMTLKLVEEVGEVARLLFRHEKDVTKLVHELGDVGASATILVDIIRRRLSL